jgi:tetratricopeptide (TPR) repeat protein
MEYYLDALGLSRERGDKPTECRILVACGNIQIQGAEFEAAHENFEKALKLASALEDPAGQLGSLAGLMKTSAYKDNVELAEMYGEKALNLVSQLQDPEAELSVIESLVGLLVGHEQYTNALPHFERGLKLAAEQQDGDRRLNFLTGLAFAHYNLTELDRAQELYQELLDEAVRLQNPIAESTALGRLSAILTEREDLPGALEHAQRALERAHETENTALVAEQQVLAALAHRDLGDEEKASLYFKDAIAAYTGIGEEALAAQVNELSA